MGNEGTSRDCPGAYPFHLYDRSDSSLKEMSLLQIQISKG